MNTTSTTHNLWLIHAIWPSQFSILYLLSHIHFLWRLLPIFSRAESKSQVVQSRFRLLSLGSPPSHNSFRRRISQRKKHVWWLKLQQSYTMNAFANSLNKITHICRFTITAYDTIATLPWNPLQSLISQIWPSVLVTVSSLSLEGIFSRWAWWNKA
jgi:hypothetical protein